MRPITAKEKLRERVDSLSEDEAREMLALLDEGWRPGDVVDERAEFSALARSATDSMLRWLEEEERAEHGETIGEAWEREGPG